MAHTVSGVLGIRGLSGEEAPAEEAAADVNIPERVKPKLPAYLHRRPGDAAVDRETSRFAALVQVQPGKLDAAFAQQGESLFKVPVFKADAEAAGDAGAGGLTGAVALNVIVHAQADGAFMLAVTERGADTFDLFKIIEVHYAPAAQAETTVSRFCGPL